MFDDQKEQLCQTTLTSQQCNVISQLIMPEIIFKISDHASEIQKILRIIARMLASKTANLDVWNQSKIFSKYVCLTRYPNANKPTKLMSTNGLF